MKSFLLFASSFLLFLANATLAELIASEQSNTATSIGQVTPVNQLSDVQPTDWAFQGVQSPIDRYACITSNADRSFKGNRGLTRDEFAAGLNACLNRNENRVTKKLKVSQKN
ncbi:MAG: hypothetical protein WBA07_20710 [Rivularia sp. (in: cyanobacteria)]